MYSIPTAQQFNKKAQQKSVNYHAYYTTHVSTQNNKSRQVCNFFDKLNKFSKQNYLSEFRNLSVIEPTSAQYQNRSQHGDSNDRAPAHPTPTFKLVRRYEESS